MSADLRTSFLTYYIRSLAERSRVEKSGIKIGFDWIIYNLALADGFIPYRLPFIRGGADESSKTKTENEFGIDISFLSSDRKTLRIFVLKDEVLNSTTWTSNDFDTDLRKASEPDLSGAELKDVNQVIIVLAYNKDENHAGIQLYDRLVANRNPTIRGNVSLSFERWNLSTLAEKVKGTLLTPSLLPQRFFSLFTYICSQYGDFRHGSDEWSNQLIPNWRHFLDDLLKENADERTVRLVPVALLIIREYSGKNPTAETGWIELTEWAMLAAWRTHQASTKGDVKEAVMQMWVGFYVAELGRYYEKHEKALSVEHSLETNSANYVGAIASSVVTYWHIARMGILAVSYAELLPNGDEKAQEKRVNAMRLVANWLAGLLNASAAGSRPLIDLHHIELFLIWRTMAQVGRHADIYKWLTQLLNCLLVRRAGAIPIPFIEGHNSLELVFECVSTGERPSEFCDQSSALVLYLLEFCFSLNETDRNELLARFYQQIVLGQDSYGKVANNSTPLDLMGWTPPEDWAKKFLVKTLADEGDTQTFNELDEKPPTDGSLVATRIEQFVRKVRESRKTTFPTDIPVALIILASLKHRSPLPPELWRFSIFGPIVGEDGKA